MDTIEQAPALPEVQEKSDQHEEYIHDFKKTSTYAHACRELKALGYIPLDQEQEDGPNKWIQESVLELLDVFSRKGHSGMSAPYCVGMFEKLALHKPLSPLTGEESEWDDVGEGMYRPMISGSGHRLNNKRKASSVRLISLLECEVY